MKRFEKRLLSLLLCAILLLGIIPAGMITAAADGTGQLEVEGVALRATGASSSDASYNPVDITDDGFTLEYNGNLLYGISVASFGLNCAAPSPNIADLVITGQSTDSILSFDYEPYLSVGNTDLQNQVISIASGAYSSGTLLSDNRVDYVSGHMEFLIPANSSRMIQFKVMNKKGFASLKVSNIKYTAKPDVYSDVMIKAVGEGTGKVTMTKNADCVTLTAQADEGSCFIGYIDPLTGNILGTDDVYSFRPVNEYPVEALFGKTPAQNNFRIGRYDGGYCFTDTLDEALKMVRYFSDKTIIVNNNGIELDGSYTIPSDVTFVVPEQPSGNDCVLYTNDPHIVTLNTGAGVYRRLILKSGSALEVKGTLYVGGSMYVEGTNPHSMTGNYGVIHVQSGAEINLNSGAELYAWGFVTGNGVINAAAGSTTYEMLQICDWRAGTNTMYSILAGAFPFEQFYVQNIESEIIFSPGASESVIGLGYMLGEAFPVTLPFIGVEGSSLFSVNNGTISKYVGLTWDDSTFKATGDKKLHIDISGTAKVSHIPLVSVFGISGDVALPSGGSGMAGMISTFARLDTNFLPIPISNMSIDLAENSYLYVNQPLTITPGSDISIGEGSLFDLNASVVVYDPDAWCNSNNGTALHFTGSSGNDVVKLQHSPSYTDTRNNSTMAAAANTPHIVIDGTLKVSDGIDLDFYTLVSVVTQLQANTSEIKTAIESIAYNEPDGVATAQWIQNNIESTILPQYMGQQPITKQVINCLDLIGKYCDSISFPHYSFSTTDTHDEPGAYIYNDTVHSDIISNGTGSVLIEHPVAYVKPVIAIDRFPSSIDFNPDNMAEAISTLRDNIVPEMFAEPAWLKNADGSYDTSPIPTGYGPEELTYNMFVYKEGVWEPQYEASDWDGITGEVIAWSLIDDEADAYDITWLDDNGDELGATTVFEGETPSFPIPEKPESGNCTYTFAGWERVDDSSSAAPAPAEENAAYMATYTASAKSYTVNFYDEDGSTLLSTQTVDAGCSPDATGISSSKGSGLNAELFTGWASGGTIYSDNALPVIDSDTGFTATYKQYFDEQGHQTLQDQSEIDYNLYFDFNADEANASSLHYSCVKGNVTEYKEAVLISDGGSYKYRIQLAPAELTFAQDVTLTVNGVSLDYSLQASNYADALFASASVDNQLSLGAFYLVGNFNGTDCWADNIQLKYKLAANTDSSNNVIANQYKIEHVYLRAGDTLKVVQYNGSAEINGWYPNGEGNDYTISDTGYYWILLSTTDEYDINYWWYNHLHVEAENFSRTDPVYARSVTSALMNYGTKAQTYFSAVNGIDYNTADPANDHVNGNIYTYTDEDTDAAINAASAASSSTMAAMTEQFNGTLEYYGTTFVLNSGTVMRHYFYLTDKTAPLPTATFSVSGRADVTAQPVKVGNFIYFDYVCDDGTGIPGPELGRPVTITINGISGSYCFYNYAKLAVKAANKAGATSDDQNLGALMRAMYWYSVESSAYFNV